MNRLILFDSHALLFRAYHAMPGFTTPDGRPSGAVYGFVNVLIRVMRELEPTWVVATFDAPGPTFRDVLYADYKGTRAETPADIITQEPMVKDALAAFGIPHLALPGFEADDLIATLTAQALMTGEQRSAPPAGRAGIRDQKRVVEEVVIVTGDRDLLQLSQPKVKIYLLRQGMKDITLLDEAAVTELVGLAPRFLLDWKALRGDSSDNIHGVPGVGDKTALAVIERYQTLENLYAILEKTDVVDGISPRIRTALLEHKDRAFANRELLTVRYDAPVTLDLDAARLTNYRQATARATLESFGFKTVLNRLPADQDEPFQRSLF